jgi:hypothetical protein
VNLRLEPGRRFFLRRQLALDGAALASKDIGVAAGGIRRGFIERRLDAFALCSVVEAFSVLKRFVFRIGEIRDNAGPLRS